MGDNIYMADAIVRVDDWQRRAALTMKLAMFGYEHQIAAECGAYFLIANTTLQAPVLRQFHTSESTIEYFNGRFLQCGDDAELFEELALMRCDTPIGQWHIKLESLYTSGVEPQATLVTLRKGPQEGVGWTQAKPEGVFAAYRHGCLTDGGSYEIPRK